VKDFGADVAFDYKDPSTTGAIRKRTRVDVGV
jgi:hypothetical protein